jgi:Kef-type K+ transport system membrane component KefB
MKEIFFSFLIGTVIGFVFCQLVRKLRDSQDILIIAFGTVIIASGISISMHLSLILVNLVIGFVMVNTRHESLVRRVMAPISGIMPLFFVLFFCLAGANLELSALPALGLVGIVYVIARSVGLIGGARLGAMVGKVEEKVKKYVGLGILSQAGVAIGLSLIVKQDFIRLDSMYNVPRAVSIGGAVLTTITATCIFFEIVGPILTKVALVKAGEIPHQESASSMLPEEQKADNIT